MARKPQKKSYKILSIDPQLQDYEGDINLRMERHARVRQQILGDHENLSDVANGHLFFGFHRTETGWVYREWAPAAEAMHLFGEFNQWNRTSHPMTRKENGVWEIELEGKNALWHKCLVKVIVTHNGQQSDHIPTYIHRAVQDPTTRTFSGQIWAPEQPFEWTDGGYGKRKIGNPLIYECHIGMAQEREGVGTYREFADKILPRIKADGYNAIQLMAIQEHPYYASFGYQVSNFFAASSWYGEPDDLKYLINRAHDLGLFVLLDTVHSHACPNVNEGLNLFDGTEYQFFHAGGRGNHSAWGSKVFNYGKPEVLHFLLSNLKYWMSEYHFDGFRFDGVTSMLYLDHGLGTAFDSNKKYFSMNTDVEAVTYLQLASELIHTVNPFAICIAEDMSAMPGMCLPIRYGGIGFDYRLSMGLPDFWIKLLKQRDEDWDLGRMWYELSIRRAKEKNVAYCESHDQALVGDKTLIFRMADAEMYTGMNKTYESVRMDRAIALHKLIRFITLTVGGEGYLNFMGNEFGHPEWIDFPREGNGWSYKYARRQWSLADNGMLKYEWLGNFDKDMLKFVRKHRVLAKSDLQCLSVLNDKKLVTYTKGGLLYVFNFHPTCSYESEFVCTGSLGEGKFKVIFSSDEDIYGGHNRISEDVVYATKSFPGKGYGFQVYLPSRTALVLQKIPEPTKK
ncbi:MAG: alpha-amylase family glycosyl hydrolase [Clostridia bacterium]|nr:alpha-amylase family glycosyl hydrolase [Clostridia bacterium]